MVTYNSVILKILKPFTIILGIIVALHILVTMVIGNAMNYNIICLFTLGIISIFLIVSILFFFKLSTNYTDKIYDLKNRYYT